MRKVDITGQKFNRLLVLGEAKSGKRVKWFCRCDCGNEVSVSSDHLRNGHTKSCGCLNSEKRIEKAKKMNEAWTKYEPWELTARSVWRKRYFDKGELSFNEFYKLSQMNCHYCGGGPNNKQNVHLSDKKSSIQAKKNGGFIYNGLDRVDNLLPHQLDNVVPCCKWCNISKRDLSVIDFKNWIIRIFENFASKNIYPQNFIGQINVK